MTISHSLPGSLFSIYRIKKRIIQLLMIEFSDQ